MAADVPRINEVWYFKARNVVVAGIVIDGDTEDVTMTYTTTHNGATYLSGTMIWELDGIAGQWVAKLTLPPTPGVLTARAIASLTGDIAGSGSKQQSVRVIA